VKNVEPVCCMVQSWDVFCATDVSRYSKQANLWGYL